MITVGELLQAPKCVHSVPKHRVKAQMSHLQWDCDVEAQGVPGRFIVGLRVNVALPESFSFFLRYDAPDSAPAVLLRVNGDHGLHKNPDGSTCAGPHVHTPTQSQLSAAPTPLASGPKYAAALPAPCQTMSAAWEEMRARACITPSKEVDSAIEGVNKKLAKLAVDQLNLPLVSP